MDQVKNFAGRFKGDELITVKIEDCGEPYLVQRGLLYASSNYFVAALGGSFKESTGRILELPGCDKDTFELFLYWACHRELPSLADMANKPEEWKSFTNYLKKIQVNLALLRCFADTHLMPALQNSAMRMLLRCLKRSSTEFKAVKIAFELSSLDSVLIKALMDELVCDHEAFIDGEEELDPIMDILGAKHGFMREWSKRLIMACTGKLTRATENDESEYMVD